MTGIIDQEGNRTASWSYDNFGRALSVAGANGVNAYQFAYQPDDRFIKVTDPLGTVRTLNYQNAYGRLILINSDQPCASYGRDVASKTVGNAGDVVQITDYKGNRTLLGYDYSRNLVTSITHAAYTSSQTQTTLQYSPVLRQPTLIQAPGIKDQRSYDAAGNLIQRSLTDTATGITRTTLASYNQNGQMLTSTDADGNVTAYTYDSSGNLVTITDALGYVTRFTYDTDGRVLSKVDPNNLTTKYTYDSVGRLISKTVGTENTTYGYDRAGNLSTMTLPNGYALTLTYDAAQRLTDVTDTLGDHLVYTLDAIGNRIGEKLYDPNGTLTVAHSRIYDALNRLYQDVGAQGQTTTYGYDANSNLTDVQDPLSHSTQIGYDPLNRPVQTVDALNGVTAYDYDPNGHLSQVATPNGAATQILHNGFGEVVQEVSPDRGTTTYTYDAAGNLVTKTDARGVIAQYRYDALNRRTAINYSATSSTAVLGPNADVSLTYDHAKGCTNGIGRLCSVQDQTGTTHYAYDAYGNLLRQTHTGLAGHNHRAETTTTRYRYDAANQLMAITYPDGRVVNYRRDVHGRIQDITASINGKTQTLVHHRTYRADDQLLSQAFGNGLTDQRQYTPQGQLDIWTLIGKSVNNSHRYDYDAAGNLTDQQNNNGQTRYQYDALNRLTDELQATHHNAYSYDGNGNRLTSLLADGSTKAYSYVSQSNRLAQIGSTAVSLDAAGNTLNDGHYLNQYDAAGRLSQVSRQDGSLIASYRYDYRGLRLVKSTSAGTTHFEYDVNGQLLSEQDPGHVQRERDYVWAGSTPVAQIDGGRSAKHHPRKSWLPRTLLGFLHEDNADPEGEDGHEGNRDHIYYLHTDAMGTPRLATNDKQQVVWRWNADAFGVAGQVTGQDPDDRHDHDQRDHDRHDRDRHEHGDDVHPIQMNLRYRGQYCDQETGLFYNWNRYYDPNTGRYGRNDPIGLMGGRGTYVYVNGDPISRVDPLGLIGPQESSIQNEIDVAIARGDVGELETILEGANPSQAAQINRALTPARDLISGGLKRSPSYATELEGSSYAQICKISRSGGALGKKAKQMKKLIEQSSRLKGKGY